MFLARVLAPGRRRRTDAATLVRRRSQRAGESGLARPVALLEHALLEAHDPRSGRYDALRVSQSLGLSVAELAQMLGWTSRGLRKNPTSPRLQEPLTRLVATATLLRELLGGSLPHVRIWLRAPHPGLGGCTPLACLLAGQIEPVEDLVQAMAAGQPD